MSLGKLEERIFWPPSFRQISNSLRMAGAVLRWHTWPTLQKQRVDSHTWQVIRLYIDIWGIPEKEIFYFMIFHDCSELKIGDMPSYAKQADPHFRTYLKNVEGKADKELGILPIPLSHRDHRRFKYADILERVEFSLEEYNFGNRHALPALEIAANDILSFWSTCENPDDEADRYTVGKYIVSKGWDAALGIKC